MAPSIEGEEARADELVSSEHPVGLSSQIDNRARSTRSRSSRKSVVKREERWDSNPMDNQITLGQRPASGQRVVRGRPSSLHDTSSMGVRPSDSTTSDRRDSNPHLVTGAPHSSALVRQRTRAAVTRSVVELRPPDDARQKPIRVGEPVSRRRTKERLAVADAAASCELRTANCSPTAACCCFSSSCLHQPNELVGRPHLPLPQTPGGLAAALPRTDKPSRRRPAAVAAPAALAVWVLRPLGPAPSGSCAVRVLRR